MAKQALNRIKKSITRIAFERSGHHFCFIVPIGHEKKFLPVADKWAADESFGFSWHDACLIRAELLEIPQ